MVIGFSPLRGNGRESVVVDNQNCGGLMFQSPSGEMAVKVPYPLVSEIGYSGSFSPLAGKWS